MKKNDIIRLAGESGFNVQEFIAGSKKGKLSVFDYADICIYDKLEELARAVANIEREECAKLCDNLADQYIGEEGPMACNDCATLIRSKP